MDEYRTRFDLDAIILLAHMTRTNMKLSGDGVGTVIAEHDIVFGVWPDATNVESVSTMPIKGGRTMLLMQASGYCEARVAAFLCEDQRHAKALRDQHGDGAPSPLS